QWDLRRLSDNAERNRAKTRTMLHVDASTMSGARRAKTGRAGCGANRQEPERARRTSIHGPRLSRKSVYARANGTWRASARSVTASAIAWESGSHENETIPDRVSIRVNRPVAV